MNNLKALIVDDEALACDMLEYLIARHIPEIGEIKKCTSAVKGIQLVKDFLPDILFLDVQMPFMNGFELLEKIPEKKFSVIFTTAFNKYAIKAIRFSALDYLLKPVDTDELKIAVQRFINTKTAQSNHSELYKNFIDNLKHKEAGGYKLALNSGNGIVLISPVDILRCEAVSNYTRFYFSNDKPMLVSKTIKEFEELLSSHGFLRVHKSHLVNLSKVKEVTAENYLKLVDNSLIEISRRRKQEVLEALQIKR